MVGIVLSVALAFTSHGAATQARASAFPNRGIVVPGKSIGGISLGMTEGAVKRRWGTRFKVCKYCPLPTWLFEYPTDEPLGAGVKFLNDRVVAVFTLGSPVDWGLKAVMMGDPISNVYSLYPNPGTANCIGYDALTVRTGKATTSFYSASGVVYGFALTAPSQPPCQ
jgi:hypothetical protein